MILKNIFIFLTVWHLCVLNLYAQPISGTIRNNKSKKIYLNKVIGGRIVPLDSTQFDHDNYFHFEAQAALPIGFYQLLLPTLPSLDIIVNNEPVEVQTDYEALLDSLVIIRSLETQIYQSLRKFEKSVNAKLNALAQVEKLYAVPSVQTDFKSKIRHEINTLSALKADYRNQLLQQYPHTFIAKYMRANQLPDFLDHPQLIGTYRDSHDFLLDHYFDNIDFNDASLLHSDLFPVKYAGYLTLFRDSTEQAMIHAVDFILSLSAQNPELSEFSMGYLLEYFENSTFDRVFFHISEIFTASKGCSNEELSFDLDRSRKIRQSLMPGQKAPDMTLEDIYDQPVSLHRFQAKTFLIMFWATWCPHCLKVLPDMIALYKKYHPYGLEIFAVSIDTQKYEWIRVVKDQHLPWVNVVALQGWQSDAVEKYNVLSTPTFFLLDQGKNILGRISRIEQIEEKVQQALEGKEMERGMGE